MSLPDADALVLDILSAAVAGVNFGTQIPDDLLDRLPFAVVRRFGGASVDPRFLDRATVSVDVWATPRGDAWQHSSDIRDALRGGVNDTTALGHIVTFREVSAPAELRTAGQPGNVWRFNATYSLFLRPATV